MLLRGPKERHKGSGEGAQAVAEGLEGGLTTEGIAEQDGDEVDDVIVPSAPPGQADLLGNGVQDAGVEELSSKFFTYTFKCPT